MRGGIYERAFQGFKFILFYLFKTRVPECADERIICQPLVERHWLEVADASSQM